VVATFGRHVEVMPDAGDTAIGCVVRGRRLEPVCGDRVRLALPAEGRDAAQGVIESIEPRRNLMFRRDAFREKLLASNLDAVLCVVALQPAFSEDLVSRCLIAAEAAGLDMAIALNKIDLPGEDAARGRLAPFTALGYPVIGVSAREGAGHLLERLAGRRTLLIGQSGMGKSTLINALVPQARAATGDISIALDSGRHTTTSSRLYALPAGGDLLDSPGLQAFGLAHLDRRQLASAFREFRALMGQCRFGDCAHRSEPDCAVLAAVARGDVHPTRLQTWHRLLDERPRGY